MQGRALLHAGIDHSTPDEAAVHEGAPGPATADLNAAGGVVTDNGRSYQWLKWVAAVGA